MNKKSILIKSQNLDFIQKIIFHLKEFKQIHFFYFYFNKFHTITIQCYNYYNSLSKLYKNNLYGDYTFLYSVVSVILSDLFIEIYENNVVKILLKKYQITSNNLSKFSNISSLLLDKNSPLEISEILYKKRKNDLTNVLFQTFKKRNYIFLDYFLYFEAPNYKKQLEEILEAAFKVLENESLYHYIMQFIFPNI